MSELPPDPLLPDKDAPMAKYMLEGSQLMGGFVNVASLSTLVENLNRADRRDVELVAMFANDHRGQGGVFEDGGGRISHRRGG
jgi:hypothetical protein